MENRSRKTLREMFEEAYGNKEQVENDGIYICDDDYVDDDDADCFCDD